MAMVLAMPIVANAGTVYVGNEGANTAGYKSISSGATFHLAEGGNYGKCTNAWSYTCKGSGVLMEYSSQSGGSGTQTNPYVYSGCSFVSCACQHDQFLSGINCVDCDDQSGRSGTVAVTTEGEYHTETTCDLCMSDKLRITPAQGVINCLDCPANSNGCNGTGNFSCRANFYKNQYQCIGCEMYATSPSGSTNHTQCCYAETVSLTDDYGSYYYKGGCCYSN